MEIGSVEEEEEGEWVGGVWVIAHAKAEAEQDDWKVVVRGGRFGKAKKPMTAEERPAKEELETNVGQGQEKW